MGFLDRLSHAWNAFKGNENYSDYKVDGPTYNYRPDRPKVLYGRDKSIVTSILNRMSVDCSAINIVHARIDDNNNYVETINSKLNNCLKIDANTDQIGKAFMQDVVMSMFTEGVVAIVPTDTDLNPKITGGYDVESMRTGKIVTWYPKDVKVRLYNEKTAQKEEIVLPKKMVAIIENPFYAVMNESNSVLKRLLRILNNLDIINEQNASGKIDLIIQLPYLVKGEKRKEQAEARRKEVEDQLVNSKYGVAYTDGTEKITQLNRSLENTYMNQVEYFTNLLYAQLGISKTVFEGTATEEEILNYYNRTINPIMSAIADEMSRKFLTKTARTQGQYIWYFRDPFDLIPVNKLSEMADTFIRNEILTKNEVRGILGFKPSDDPSADELQNPNLYPEEENQNGGEEMLPAEDVADLQGQIDSLDDYDAELDELENQLAQSALTSEDFIMYGVYKKYDEVLAHAGIEADEMSEEMVDDYLSHYASPYYDPVYAHEYYEKHKKLKGRNTLSDKGKEVADYVTKQLNAERDKKIASSKTNTSNSLLNAQNTRQNAINSSSNTMSKNIEAKKAATQSSIDNHKAQMDNQISQLQDQLKEWGASGKKGKTKEIRNKIARLREQNNEAKAKLQEDLSSYSYSERSEHANRSNKAKTEYSDSASKIKTSGSKEVSKIKEDYENRLAKEMEKIMNEYSANGKSGRDSDLAKHIDAAHKERIAEREEKKKSKKK